MLKSFGTEFKVGLFALVSAVTLGYMFFVLSPNTFNDVRYKRYYTMLDNAAGIVPKSQVKANGISKGHVVSVELDGRNTRVYLNIEEHVRIPVGSKIEIRSVGLLGDRHLELVRFDGETERFIEEGGYIPEGKAGGMEALVKGAGEIAEDIKKITTVLAKVLGGKDGEETVSEIVSNIRGITADIKASSATLKSVIGDRESDLNDIVTNVRDGVADLRTFSAGLKEIMDQENRERIDRILASFDETMVDVKGGMRNINLIAEKVEKGEGTLGKLVNEDDALAELESAIKDIRKVLAPATKLQVAVDYHMEARRDESSQHYFNMLFQTRPDRFYLLGATDTSVDKIETEETLINNDPDAEEGPTTKRRETIRTERALKFNLQFGKRWYNAALRFGLFETTGGIAADFFLMDDRIKFSFEAFDWDTLDKSVRRTAHFKAYASILFYKHVYLLAGIDDPTRTDPETGKANKELNTFFGAGLQFNDDDLKAILGTAALAL